MSDGFLQKEAPSQESLNEQLPQMTETDTRLGGTPDQASVESRVFEQPPTSFEQPPVSVMPANMVVSDDPGETTPDPNAPKEYVKDEVTLEVEKILEDGLGDFVQTMPTDVKWRFLHKGQEIAIVLAGMVRDYKVKVKQVIHLIRDWLLTIPGVNKFFLEQEAKIKTDRILDLEKVRHDGLPVTP